MHGLALALTRAIVHGLGGTLGRVSGRARITVHIAVFAVTVGIWLFVTRGAWIS